MAAAAAAGAAAAAATLAASAAVGTAAVAGGRLAGVGLARTRPGVRAGARRRLVCARAVAGSPGSGSGGASASASSELGFDAPPAAPRARRPGSFVARPGALQGLPMVPPSEELMGTCFKAARKQGPKRGMKSALARNREQYTRQMDTLTVEFTTRLRTLCEGFVRPDRLHAFERELVLLTLGEGRYEDAISGVEKVRKKIVDVGKENTRKVARATTLEEIEDTREAGFAHVRSVYMSMGWAVDELKEVAKVCRRMPVVDLEVPTLALVGAPNVGKSSLVATLSSGKPEVCNYPFTTKAISMGHMFIDAAKLEPAQITDTPGLLARPDEERNDIEGLAIAALEHLPTAALFAFDMSEECGTSVQDQLSLFEELRGRFPHKPWITVSNKVDLDHGEGYAAAMAGARAETLEHVEAALRVSVLTNEGIDALRAQVLGVLTEAAATREAERERLGLTSADSGIGFGPRPHDREDGDASEGESSGAEGAQPRPRKPNRRSHGRAAVSGSGVHG